MAASPSSKKRTLSSGSESNKRQKQDSTSASSSTSSLSPGGQNVRVVARIRPLSTKEVNESSKEAVSVVPSLDVSKTVRINTNIGSRGGSNNAPKSWEYDAAFGPSTSQQQLYEHTVGDMVRNNIYKGFNVTVMAYGQTGSGKTFTMGTEGGASTTESNETNAEDGLTPPVHTDGIIPRAVFDLFDQRRSIPNGENRVTIEMSYLEIYNEEVHDLLIPAGQVAPTLQIRDSSTEGVIVQNLSTREVTSPQDVSRVMNEAATRRATASTAMNAVSSRSHAICTLHVSIEPRCMAGDEDVNNDEEESSEEDATALVKAKLTLVDLAGSERIKRTGAEGKRMQEGININKGLLALGNCVSALAALGQQGKSAATSNSHVPYRDSKLTRILQDSLGGNSRTVMVACISPADSNVEETVNTLRYAQRTRSIQNSAVRNVVASDTMSIAEAIALKRENDNLKLQLAQALAQLKAKPTVDTATADPTHRNALTVKTFLSPKAADIRYLTTIEELQSNIASLEAKVEILEDQKKKTTNDWTTAIMQADKWQQRYQDMQQAAKAQGVNLETTDEESSSSIDITTGLRQEIIDLKSKLQEALADAEFARKAAAAMLASNGNVESAEAMASSSNDDDDNNTNDNSILDESMDDDEKVALAAEVTAMGNSIELKEKMREQMDKERRVMDDMRHHFEKAVKHLQSEVETLSQEKDALLSKMGENDSDDTSTSTMKKRISELEARIKQLRQKEAEHKKSLKLREAAEEKCARLAAEIQKDKSRRAKLMNQLKEQDKERRNEKLIAKKEAAKLIRDSNKLKVELQKVKDAAAKQAVVLKRKGEEALRKQKREAELRAKKLQNQEEKKKLAEKRANSKQQQRTDSPSTSVDGDRKAELLAWLNEQIESMSAFNGVKAQIKEQKKLISEAADKKLSFQKSSTFIRGGGVTTVEPPSNSPAVTALDEEIDMRTNIIETLEEQLNELMRTSKMSPMSQHNSGSPGTMDLSVHKFTASDYRDVFNQCFTRVLQLTSQIDSLERKLKNATTGTDRAVGRAVERARESERRQHEDEIMRLKLDHGQAMMSLLSSTNTSISESLQLNCLNSIVDGDVVEKINKMLATYEDTCKKAVETVSSELMVVKEAHEGMKKVVDTVATEIIQNNSPKPKQQKKKKPKNRLSTGNVSEDELALLVDDDMEPDNNSDDSDWSPSRHKTPGPKRRNRKSADSVAKNNNNKGAAEVPKLAIDNGVADTSMEAVPEGDPAAEKAESMESAPSMSPVAPARLDENEADENRDGVTEVEQEGTILKYMKLTCKDLKEMLRARELPVSGNKSDLIARLRSDDAQRAEQATTVVKARKTTTFANESTPPKENRRSRGGKIKVELPETPPQSTKKGTELSTKKLASVRRSTIFNRRDRDDSLSPGPSDVDDTNDGKPNVDQENVVVIQKSKPKGKVRGGLRARNLGSSLSNASAGVGNQSRALQDLGRNLMP